MFDTHCHLNFKAFDGRVEELIKAAKSLGVENIVVPGTDIPTSKKAVEIAEKYSGIYVAVGIHPHHVFEIFTNQATKIFPQVNSSLSESKGSSNIHFRQNFVSLLDNLEHLLSNPKVVAIGEVGIDRHIYEKTRHKDYKVDEKFVDLQKEFFIKQIKLAKKYQKTLIIHNREAKKDVLEILSEFFSDDIRAVFHCCEPDEELLKFAKEHKMFIGVDGDIFYWEEKQKFIKKVPLEILVLETDSPFLAPDRHFPNEPKNIKTIAKFVASLKNISTTEVEEQTTKNAQKLFNL